MQHLLAGFLYSITHEGKEQSMPNFRSVERISNQTTVPKLKFDFDMIASAPTLNHAKIFINSNCHFQLIQKLFKCRNQSSLNLASIMTAINYSTIFG